MINILGFITLSLRKQKKISFPFFGSMNKTGAVNMDFVIIPGYLISLKSDNSKRMKKGEKIT